MQPNLNKPRLCCDAGSQRKKVNNPISTPTFFHGNRDGATVGPHSMEVQSAGAHYTH